MQKGQVFVTLLFFIIIGITIIAAETIVLFTNIQSSGTTEQSINAYYIAESGAEEALLRLGRDQSYTGQTLSIGSGNAVVQVSSGTITSTGTYGKTKRKIQVTTQTVNGVVKVVTWREI